ncbi:MAG: copper resistance protein B [Steroidobacteraceae bacterium]
MSAQASFAMVALLVATPIFAQTHEHQPEHHVTPPEGEPVPQPDSAAAVVPVHPAADSFYSTAAMSRARRQLRLEHGGEQVSSVILRLAEYQGHSADGGYRWDASGWVGGDVNRFVVKSEGEGSGAEGVGHAELQGLYSRAIGVYTDLHLGVRQDFEPGRRTYASVGFETLLPYWFDVEGAAFVSVDGELLGRLEGAYEARLTNRWILQPRVELNLAAQDSAATRTGSGFASAEIGLRLRFEIRRELAPYIGVSWEKQFARTADYARAAGEDPQKARVVFGLRAFF